MKNGEKLDEKRNKLSFLVELCSYTQHDREANTAQPKKDKLFLFSSRFSPFNCCLSVVCSLTKGITPDICRLCLCPDK